MPRPGRIVAAALVLAGSAAGCGDGAAKPDAAAPTAPLALPSTTERLVGDPRPEGVDPTTTTAAAPTTLPSGLPRDLGIPGAGNLSLGEGSSIRNRFAVRDVPFLEVVAFVEQELVALGWAVQAAPGPEPGQVAFTFTGPGAAGQAVLAPQADGTVEVSLLLQGGA